MRDIRRLVITSVNNQPVRVEDVVEGGRGILRRTSSPATGRRRRATRRAWAGSATGSRTTNALRDRCGPLPTSARMTTTRSSASSCMRKNEDTLPALKDVKAKVKELNDPSSGRMLPGVKIEPYYDRTELINVTTETVTENLVVGIVLVIVDPVHVPQQHPHRGDRGDQYPAGPVVRFLGAVPARQVGQPAVDRRRRFRHHRRFVGDHGRKHLPPPDDGEYALACR